VHRPLPAASFDTSVPALVLKIGNYVRGHGAMGAIRSLGRAGVPVFAVTEDRWTPAAVSRYLTRRIVAPTTGLEGEAYLVDRIAEIARSVGTPRWSCRLTTKRRCSSPSTPPISRRG
jgi:hypothetical protein